MPKSITRKIIERKTTDRNLVSIKLTEVQRTILAGAALRDDGAATLPEQMAEKAAQKFAAVRRPARLAPPHVCKSNALAEIGAMRIACKKGVTLGIQLRHDMRRACGLPATD